MGEFAAEARLSPSRVHALIQQEKIRARKSGGIWLISDTELNRRRNVARPLSPRMTRAFLAVLSGQEPVGELDPAERSRLRKRLEYVRNLDDPSPTLASWLGPRAELHRLSVSTGDVAGLQRDVRIILSGISDPRAGMSSAHEVEAYVQQGNFSRLCSEYLMVPSDHPNVFLRVIHEFVDSPIPLGFVLADLADHNSPREDAQVKRLLSS